MFYFSIIIKGVLVHILIVSSFPELFLITKRLFCYNGWLQLTKHPIVLAIKTHRCMQQPARCTEQLSKQFMWRFKLIWTTWVQVVWIEAKCSGWKVQFWEVLDGAQNLLIFVGIVGTLYHGRDDRLCQDYCLSLKYLWTLSLTEILLYMLPPAHMQSSFCSDVCRDSIK